MINVGIITTHPIQYHAPWFRSLAQTDDVQLRVFYLWDFGVTEQLDPGFKQPILWDVPLLSGYDYEFIPNTSRHAGTGRFTGIKNPALANQVQAFNPNAILLFGYNYASLCDFILMRKAGGVPMLLRGDSHRIVCHRGAKERI